MLTIPNDQISLPSARLVPGRDDELIEYYQQAKGNNVVISATIRRALLEYWRRQNEQDEIKSQLDRIEALLNQRIIQLNQLPAAPIDDPFLSSDL